MQTTYFIGIDERMALKRFNGIVMDCNKRGTVTDVRLKALKTMLWECKRKFKDGKENLGFLFNFFKHCYPHWSVVQGAYSADKLKKILEHISVSRTTPITSEDLLDRIINELEIRTMIKIAKTKKRYCEIHPEELTAVQNPDGLDELSTRVCVKCVGDVNRAIIRGKFSGKSELPGITEMLRFLKNQFLNGEHEIPVFRSVKTHISPEKIGKTEVKEEFCEIHPDRKIAATLRRGNGISMCRGCAICLGRAMTKGRIRKDASPEEMREFLMDKFAVVA